MENQKKRIGFQQMGRWEEREEEREEGMNQRNGGGISRVSDEEDEELKSGLQPMRR